MGTGRKMEGNWEKRGWEVGDKGAESRELGEKQSLGDSGKLENCTVLCNSKRGQLQGSQKFRVPCPTAFSPQSLFQLDTNSTC